MLSLSTRVHETGCIHLACALQKITQTFAKVTFWPVVEVFH